MLLPRSMPVLEKLVGFNTVSDRPNKSLMLWVRDYLAGQGAGRGVVSGFVEQPESGGEKLNLWARIGPDKKGGIVLSGHSDVVPAEADKWQSDPFQLRAQEGRLYGRGTTDMKGFLACVLALIPDMVKAPLKRPLWLAFSCDEEIGCLGAPHLIDFLHNEKNIAPHSVIVGEPTGMRVVSAHKSLNCFETILYGEPAHSSKPDSGKSAIQAACQAVLQLQKMMEARKAQARDGGGFDPAWTTIHTGLISGGLAANIVAPECRFSWDVRTIADEKVETVLEEFKDFCARDDFLRHFAIETRALVNVPPLTPVEGSEADALARRLTGDNQVRFASYATEAGQFQQAGWPVVICGPGHLEQAHRVDEFVDADQLLLAEKFLGDLISFCSS